MKYAYKSLKHIPHDLRPREKLKAQGVDKLSEEELLAVILGSGTKDMDVLSLSREIVKRLGWEKIEQMSIRELTSIKGMGEVKAMQVKALVELSKRIREPYRGAEILSPESAYEFLKGVMRGDREKVVAVYLDLSHRVMGSEVVAVGSMNRVYLQPKDVLSPALKLSAYGVLIAHNHPQGVAKPSREDVEFTRRIKSACDLIGLELVDHLIIDDRGFVSLREEGVIV